MFLRRTRTQLQSSASGTKQKMFSKQCKSQQLLKTNIVRNPIEGSAPPSTAKLIPSHTRFHSLECNALHGHPPDYSSPYSTDLTFLNLSMSTCHSVDLRATLILSMCVSLCRKSTESASSCWAVNFHCISSGPVIHADSNQIACVKGSSKGNRQGIVRRECLLETRSQPQ